MKVKLVHSQTQEGRIALGVHVAFQSHSIVTDGVVAAEPATSSSLPRPHAYSILVPKGLLCRRRADFL